MKKVIIIAVLVLMLFSASNMLRAQTHTMSFFINAGIMASDDFTFDPFFWYGGVNLDFHLGEVIMISPELNLITHKFAFDAFFLQPAVILNFKLDKFFFGGGVEKLILISGKDHVSGDFALKLNAGLRGKNLKLTLFSTMGFDNLFKNMLIGATFGFGF